MNLRPDETELIGSWVMKDGRMAEDEVCVRIRVLTGSELQRIANSEDGWEVLYKDSSDGRYWELTYPRSEMQGGGPIALIVASQPMLQEKYGVSIDS
jgi:Immunity protein 27